MSPLFQHIKQTLELHRLIREGLGDTDEADALRDAMHETWDQLSPDDLPIVHGLSADLYSLTGDETNNPEHAEPANPPMLAEALRQGDWRQVLEIARRLQHVVDEDIRAYCRARAWAGLGLYDAAIEFIDHAARMTTARPTYVIVGLDYLVRANRTEEAVQRAQGILANPHANPRLTMRAADVLFRRAIELPPGREQTDLFEQAAAVLERALASHDDSPVAAISFGASLELAIIYRRMGNLDCALEWLERAQRMAPERFEPHLLRGIAYVALGQPPRAALEFREAIRSGATHPLPFAWLGGTPTQAPTSLDSAECDVANSLPFAA